MNSSEIYVDADCFAGVAGLFPEPMLLVTATGAIVAGNAAAAEACGRPREALEGAALEQFLVDPPEEVERYLRMCAGSGQMVPGTLRWRRAGGEPAVACCDGVAVRPGSERDSAVVLLRCRPKPRIDHRITRLDREFDSLEEQAAPRRGAKEELAAQREWLRVTLSSIGDGVVAADGHGAVVFLNPVAEQLTGWTQTDAIGRPLEEVFRIVHPQTQELVRIPAEEVMATGQAADLPNPAALIRRDGTQRPVEDSIAPIRDDAGQILGIVLIFRDITERERAAAELRESRRRLSFTLAAANVGTWDWDMRSGEIRWSDNLEGIHRMTPGSFDGTFQGLLDTVYPEDRSLVFRAVREAVEGGGDYHIEYRHIGSDGELRWFEGKGSVTYDKDGDPVRMAGVCLDVTDRKRNEEVQARLAAIVESSDDAIIGQGLDGTIVSWNDGAHRIFGYTAEEALGRSVSMISPPAHEDEMRRLLDAVRHGQRVDHLVTERVCKDGRRIHVSLSLSPIRDRIGRIIGASKIARDITEYMQAAQARARLAAIVDSSDDAIVGKTLEGVVTSWNKGAQRIFGYTAKEAIGRSITFLMPPERQDEEQQILARLMRGEVVDHFHTKRLTKDGRLIDVSLTISPIRDAHGEIVGASKIARDITQSKRIEAQLHALNETLEQRVAERTAVAEHRAVQLRALAAELTQAEQRERRRLAQVLHDHLQQLLVAARMRVAVLQHCRGDAEVAAAAEQVEDLLRQSIEASRSLTVELSPPILYDGGLPRALEWLAHRMKEEHGLRTEIHTETDAEAIDEPMAVFMFQAVRELLFNVVKHAGVDTARVTLRHSDGDRLQAIVEDEGVGAAPDRLDRGAEGGGFGLFSIRERLMLLGGEMEVDAAAGRGTRVMLTVPLHAEEDRNAGEPSGLGGQGVPMPEDRRGDQPAPSLWTAADPVGRAGYNSKIRVLLADDHKIFREGLISLLRQQPDLEIVGEASDGEEALQLARDTHPDIVIMDVTMPRLNGVEATRRVLAEMPGVRVIGLSMHEEQDMAAAMHNAGAAAYLTKDGPSHALIAAIRTNASA